MDFGSGGNTEKKAWKDIWGCGQGIGLINDVMSVQDMVDQFTAEYRAARESLKERFNY